jgi:hypothetical protein
VWSLYATSKSGSTQEHLIWLLFWTVPCFLPARGPREAENRVLSGLPVIQARVALCLFLRETMFF